MSGVDPTTGPSVAAIGGGHGLAVSLRAVLHYAGRVTAVVSTADDGGSSGRLRTATAMPAPGDLRRCLTAIAANRPLAASMEHRFETGELAGHAVGNLVLAGLVDAGMDMTAAVGAVSDWLGLDRNRVRLFPATAEAVDLLADTPTGQVRGQVKIEGAGTVSRLRVDPPTPAVPADALEAIVTADQIVLGPGSFYTSVIAAAIAPAIVDALADRVGQLVFVCNLRADETGVKNFDVARHLTVLGEHGISPDVVVAQTDALEVGDMVAAAPAVDVVLADVDRPHGRAHDADLLGPVLASLLPPT